MSNVSSGAHITQFGDHSFSTVVSKLWNSLRAYLQQLDIGYNHYKHFSLDSEAAALCDLLIKALIRVVNFQET